MRSKILFLIILFYISISHTNVFAQQRQARRQETPRPSLSIDSKKTEFDASESVIIDFKLTNNTRYFFYVQLPYGGGRLCTLTIKEQDGGKETVIPYPQRTYNQVAYVPVRIDPEYYYGKTLNLGRFPPGRYNIQANYESFRATAGQGVWTGRLTSNSIDILIRESPVDDSGTAGSARTRNPSTRIERQDTTGDGRIDTTKSYIGNRLQTIVMDRNGDEKPDVWQDFVRNVTIWDTDFDGRPDTWHYFRDGSLYRTGRDTTGDGIPDEFEDATPEKTTE